MLTKFAFEPEEKSTESMLSKQERRKTLLKKRMAQQIVSKELDLMEDELHEMEMVDHDLGKIKNDYRLLMTQMFSERVSQSISVKRLTA